MDGLTLVKRAGLKLVTNQNGYALPGAHVPACDVEILLARHQAELMAILDNMQKLEALTKRCVSALEGPAK